jgi:hypothetical protein
MLTFFANLRTFYLLNFSEMLSRRKALNRLLNAEIQLKRYEISYSLLLASNLCMSLEYSHVYSNHQTFC